MLTAITRQLGAVAVCQKQRGGIGLHDLFERNKATILLQVWRLSHPKFSSMWVQWVHQCLLKNKAFWTASIPYSKSWAFKQIMNHRSETCKFITFNMGEQSEFFMWLDPWLEHRSLVSRFGLSIIPIVESNVLARIKDFIADRRWIHPRSGHNKVLELHHLLSALNITPLNAVLWKGSKLVNLSFIWHTIRRSGTPPLWTAAVWHSYTIPNCGVFMWLALKQMLLTKDRMTAFGMSVNPPCVLCGCNAEKTEHLFCNIP